MVSLCLGPDLEKKKRYTLLDSTRREQRWRRQKKYPILYQHILFKIKGLAHSNRDQTSSKVVVGSPNFNTAHLDACTDTTPDETSRDEVELSLGTEVGTRRTGKEKRRSNETTNHSKSTNGV